MGVFYLACTPEVRELLLLNAKLGSVVSGRAAVLVGTQV